MQIVREEMNRTGAAECFLPVLQPIELWEKSGRNAIYGPDMLRAVMAVQAGDPVKLALLGDGFAVSADGFALAAAADGQPLRVRTESGRVVVGTLRGRTVEIRL